MPRYRIKYTDPATQEEGMIYHDYESLSWAEDAAYSVSDKGYYEISEWHPAQHTVAGGYWERLI